MDVLETGGRIFLGWTVLSLLTAAVWAHGARTLRSTRSRRPRAAVIVRRLPAPHPVHRSASYA